MRLTGVELDREIEQIAPRPRKVAQERVERWKGTVGRLEIDDTLVVLQRRDDVPRGRLLRLAALATGAVSGHNGEPLIEQVGVGKAHVDALPGSLNDVLQLPHIATRLQEVGAAAHSAVVGDGQQGLLVGHVVFAELLAKQVVRKDALALLVERL